MRLAFVQAHFSPTTRFHQAIKDTLERKRADVIELAQNLTDSMTEIHGAIVHCMNMILADLRRSKDVRGLFLRCYLQLKSSFFLSSTSRALVFQQRIFLRLIILYGNSWIPSGTKSVLPQRVSYGIWVNFEDLSGKSMLFLHKAINNVVTPSYLLSYEPLQFHSYCQSLIAAINEPEAGSFSAPKSEWMMTDSATTIFGVRLPPFLL